MLSAISSAEPGPWRTDRAPYQRAIMDALSNDDDPRPVIWMKSSQVGATEVMCNLAGYHMDNDPSPMLVVQATLDNADAWSKERLAPMIAESPALRANVADIKSRDSSNTIRSKSYPGGVISLVASNSPAGLRMRPIRVLLADDVDAYPASAGTEGDPVKLAIARTKAFPNRKIFLASKPTIKGLSRIGWYWDRSTQNRYELPCPQCGEFQALAWAQVRWQDDDPESAAYECHACRARWTEQERQAALQWGVWRESNPGAPYRGYHISALYSVWEGLAGIVARFVEAKASPELLKTWTNEDLGECYELETEKIEPDILHATHREQYGAALDPAALVITAGVDIQKDRIELEIVAWSESYESWSLAYHVLWGDVRYKQVWRELDEVLRAEWTTAGGQAIHVTAAGVDTGAFTDEAYKFCRGKFGRRVYALKGTWGQGPVVANISRRNRYKVLLHTIHVDPLKERLHDRLTIATGGPGYCHFPLEYRPEYFEQLTAEHPVIRVRGGQPVIRWERAQRRNEALDCRIYSMAALAIYDPDRRWGTLRKRYAQTETEELGEKVAHARRKHRRAGRKGWVQRWR